MVAALSIQIIDNPLSSKPIAGMTISKQPVAKQIYSYETAAKLPANLSEEEFDQSEAGEMKNLINDLTREARDSVLQTSPGNRIFLPSQGVINKERSQVV